MDQVKPASSGGKELETENVRLKRAIADLTLIKQTLREEEDGNFLSPKRRRRCVAHVGETLGVSERRACKVLDQPRLLLPTYFPGMIGLSTIIPTRSNKANIMNKPSKRTRTMSPILFNAIFSITYSDEAEF